MKVTTLALLLLPAAAYPATSLTFYASPMGYYACTGYAASSCMDFESSDPAHVVTKVMLKDVGGGQLEVQLFVDGEHYWGLSGVSGAQFEAQDRASGNTVSATVSWVKTRHCVTTNGKNHCADRYLAENGTISFP